MCADEPFYLLLQFESAFVEEMKKFRPSSPSVRYSLPLLLDNVDEGFMF